MSFGLYSPPLAGGERGGGLRKALTPVARKLRNDPTEAEKHLWCVLRDRNLGVKFRRQAVIGRYIVDFVCFEKKLVVEVDGGQHAQSRRDILRDKWLSNQGFGAPLPNPPHKGEGIPKVAHSS